MAGKSKTVAKKTPPPKKMSPRPFAPPLVDAHAHVRDAYESWLLYTESMERDAAAKLSGT